MYCKGKPAGVLLIAIAAGLGAPACGGSAGAGSSVGSPPTSTTAAVSQPSQTADSGWASSANAICRQALPDGSHVLVDHLDPAHVRQHGFAIISAGMRLQKLGPPSGGDAAGYAKMIELYRKSAIYHALVVRQLKAGNAGNAAYVYGAALSLADRADTMATELGATDCNRFGMVG
jgi:hypothetical protein